MTTEKDMADPTRRRFVQGLATTPLAYGVIAAAAASTAARAQAGPPTALITGASSGFGKRSAVTLARNGFRVVASMRDVAAANAASAADLTALARNEGLSIEIVEIDVDSDASVARGMNDAMARVERVDLLLNNAGVSIPGPVELSMDAARRSFETNVFGQLRMLRAVAPAMRAARNGLIIQMSSGLGRFVMPTSGVYSATKFAQEALFEAAAYELHPFGVEVAIIQPSDHATDIKPNSRRYYAEMMANLSADDRARADDYAAHLEITEREMRDAEAPPAQEVADIVLELATTPAGRRPPRVAAMPPELAAGVNELNANLQDVQSMILQGSGMGDWLDLAG